MSDLSIRLILSAVVDQFRRALGEARDAERDLGEAGEDAADTLADVGDNAGDAADELGGVDDAADKTGEAMSALKNIIALIGLNKLAGDILSTNREFESLRVQLDSATGSVEKGAEAFGRMVTLAAKTPFELKDVTDAYVRLKNFGLEPTEHVMRAVTEQAAKLGGSAETLSGFTLALGQAWGKGKLQAEEINQMIERGVPVYALLEAATGKTASQLAKMAYNGELTRDVIEKLIAKMGELAAGSNNRAMDTLNGKISNLSDAWHKFEDVLLQDKSEGLIKRIVGNSSKLLDLLAARLSPDMSNRGKLARLAEQIDEYESAIEKSPGAPDRYKSPYITGKYLAMGEIKKELQALYAERERLIALIDQEAAKKKASEQADANALAQSRAIADKAAAIADYADRYATTAEKLAIELKKAKDELGDDFTPELEARIRAKYAEKEATKEQAAGEKALLAEQLRGIETRKAALRSAADLEKKQLGANFDAAKLGLDQQVADNLLSEEAKNRRLVEMEKDLADAKLDIARKLIEQEAGLETQAVRAKISAARAEKSTAAAGSLAGVIAGGESGGSYNIYNQGTAGRSGPPLDLQSLSIAEIQQRQALPQGTPGRIFAAGKYQITPKTLTGAVSALGLDTSAPFDAATQDKIFTDYLVAAKRPEVVAYIKGVSDDIAAARTALAQEFAALPSTSGQGAHDGVAGNKATVSGASVDAALASARRTYQESKAAGLGDQTAYRQAVAGGDEEKAAKLRSLNNQLFAIEQDKVAKLRALGIQEQADSTHVAQAELAIRKDEAQKSKALALEDAQARRDADLDALAGRESAAQTAHELGLTTEEQYVGQLREFAAERLRIEQELLVAKRALLDKDALALARNLHDKEALERGYAAKVQGIAAQESVRKKAEIRSWLSPFESAIDSIVNGVISGQQSIGKAVRNAGQSIITSYAATFVKQRTMQAAEWAWEISGLAGTETRKRAIKQLADLWDTLFGVKRRVRHTAENTIEAASFVAKEGSKVATKIGSESAQTGAQIVGDQARVASTAAAEAESKGIRAASGISAVIGSAAQAAAGVYASVAAIPYVGWILGPIAAAAAFLAVAGFKAFFSEKGEWSVGADNAPYILHKKETVLPAGVADNFREVVGIVRGRTAQAGPLAEVLAGFKSGRLAPALALPEFAASLPQESEASAARAVHAARLAQAKAKEQGDGGQAAGGRTGRAGHGGDTNFHFHGDVIGSREFFDRNAKHLEATMKRGARQLKGGKK